ncbi:MAG: PAS domain-containing protein, partial [Burkholderiales bacterium]
MNLLVGTRRISAMWNAKLYRQLRPYIASLVILVLVSLLIFVIFFTVLEWQWVAFLSGILVASVLAMATRTAQAEWRILRLMAQLNKIKERLALENAERGRTAATLAMASKHHSKEHERLTQELGAHNRTKEELCSMQERLQLMSDALSIMAFYCDEKQLCRHSNTAFRTWLHLDAEQVNGRHLKELLGEDAFKSMENFVEEALRGGAVHMEWSHQFRFAQCHIEGDLIPHKNPGGQVVGFIGLLADVGTSKPPEGAPLGQAVQSGLPAHKT